MIEQLMDTFARHEDLAPAPEPVRRRIDEIATRRRRVRRGSAGVAAVAVVALFGAVFMRLDAVSPAPRVGASASAPAAASATTFLIVGTDQRPWDTDRSDLLRSDSIMLAHLPADRSVPYLISIPRDVMVPYRNGQEHLNGIFAQDGARGLRDAVRKLTGIPIAGTVEVDFAGLIAVTDAVGGVDLCVPRRAVSDHTDRIFQPGCRRFAGEEAMDYLRQRTSFAGGDFDRQLHVREYLDALYKRLGDATLPQLLRLIEAGGDALRIDTGGLRLPALFAALRDAKAGPVTIGAPAEFDDAIPGSRFQPEAAQLWAAVRDGTLADWVAANPNRVDQR